MSFTNKMDYLPNMPGASEDVQMAIHAAKRRQQQRWQILFGTFLLVAVLANIFIWSRPTIYGSQAIIHFSNSVQNSQESIEATQQHIALNQQRLISHSTLQAVSAALQKEQITLGVTQLAEMIRAESSSAGRLITLEVMGHDRHLLKPILDSWLSYYLTLINTENISNNSTEIQQYNQQIAAFEQKTTVQQEQLDFFSQHNNIISLNRDENRILNKIKGLGASQDAAEAQEAEAVAQLESIKISIKNGQQIERPADKAGIDGNRAYLQKLEAELSALADKYTQEYLQQDPVVVAKQEEAKTLADTIEQQIAQSRNLYLQDAQRNVTTTAGKSTALRGQLNNLQQQALSFNQKLEQYRRMNDALSELQQQTQILKNQLVELEVSKPFAAKIEVLEKPFTPEFPKGPDYWQDSLISLAAALLVAVFVLLLYSFIVRQKVVPGTTSNFVVIPDQHYIDQHGHALLNHRAELAQASPTLSLSETRSHSRNLPVLSPDDCRCLFDVANKQGKMVIGLLLSGVAIDELGGIAKEDFSGAESGLNIRGSFARKVSLHKDVLALTEQFNRPSEAANLLWLTALSREDFTQLIINAAHDAELTFPEQLSIDVLRHTYLTFLVSQGARLNDLEQLAGYIKPAELAQYRHVNRHGKAVELGEINSVFPFRTDIA